MTMSQMVRLAEAGSDHANDRLASFFLEKVLAATGRKLAGKASVEDQEDVAISALRSFCLGIRDGRIQYVGENQLFSLLNKIIDGKIRKLWQYHFAKKRDLRATSELSEPQIVSTPASLPSDSFSVSAVEEPIVEEILGDLQEDLRGLFGNLFASLDEHPRRLLCVLLKRDATNKQLSEILGRSQASIERYKRLIRKKLRELADHSS